MDNTKVTNVEFSTVCSDLYKDMFNHAMRLTYQDRARAQDVVQDSMIRAMNAWHKFEAGEDFWISVRAWMYRIVTNTFINEYQARKRYSQIRMDHAREIVSSMHQNAQFVDSSGAEKDDGLSAATPADITLAADQAMSEEVADAIQSLDKWQRDVIELHYIAGNSYKEISKTLKIPMGTVMSRLARARTQLESKLRVYARDEMGYREGVVSTTPVSSTSNVVYTRQNTTSLEASQAV